MQDPSGLCCFSCFLFCLFVCLHVCAVSVYPSGCRVVAELVTTAYASLVLGLDRCKEVKGWAALGLTLFVLYPLQACG